jgi:hypothetical protein
MARLAAMVVARATGSTVTTAEYRSDGGGSNKDKDDSKGNSGKNEECGSNNKGGRRLSFCLIFFFWSGS